ncbi:MAG: phosphoglycerate dehydrogenase, partial [Cyclobacteriaceae bacterium]|nr:phosphoglycerate dehydrogenase [Cyclobacteriaceae bacterium]
NQADLISFHIPLTYETKFLINDDFLDKFKKSIYLINTSRGEIADHETLIKGLKNNKIRGLGLDVLENEKLNTLSENQKERFDFLINHPNTIITPHIAGWSKASYRKISEVIARKILSIV